MINYISAARSIQLTLCGRGVCNSGDLCAGGAHCERLANQRATVCAGEPKWGSASERNAAGEDRRGNF
ncbi:hypothetical protein PUN28_013646 [Cardiocondyla obscurior]|uniref:Uncharacterized protein n=1 Tax=Cardiocondyla obscurior TaxID=286306 RepID=A0AAW2F6F9_9HYME